MQNHTEILNARMHVSNCRFLSVSPAPIMLVVHFERFLCIIFRVLLVGGKCLKKVLLTCVVNTLLFNGVIIACMCGWRSRSRHTFKIFIVLSLREDAAVGNACVVDLRHRGSDVWTIPGRRLSDLAQDQVQQKQGTWSLLLHDVQFIHLLLSSVESIPPTVHDETSLNSAAS